MRFLIEVDEDADVPSNSAELANLIEEALRDHALPGRVVMTVGGASEYPKD